MTVVPSNNGELTRVLVSLSGSDAHGDGAGGCRASLFCVISEEITLLSACVLTKLTLIRKVALFRWIQNNLWRIMSIQMDLRRCRA
jgi:hypothetical protein